MPQAFDHLHTGVWSFLDESQEDRITRLYMPKWVSYAGASEALARMEHLLRHPPCGRMPSMLLYGDSDSGLAHRRGRGRSFQDPAEQEIDDALA